MNRLNTNNSGKTTRGPLSGEPALVHIVDGVLTLPPGTTDKHSKRALPLGGGEVEDQERRTPA